MLWLSANSSRSREGAWIEIFAKRSAVPNANVAPVRERGLKCNAKDSAEEYRLVAPVRERGLKFITFLWIMAFVLRRSREGAWIEIVTVLRSFCCSSCRRSREGAWIEIPWCATIYRCKNGRSREGAWIEMRRR